MLEISVASFDLYVTSKTIAGKTLQQIVDDVEEARGVLLRGITRGGHEIPIGTNTVVERGDILHVSGSETAVEKLAPVVGRVIHPTDETRFCCARNSHIHRNIGRGRAHNTHRPSENSLGTSVGTLLAGCVVGWMRSVRPWFGIIPDAAILFMRSIGLAAFVAMIGLKAGPIFVQAVREFGYILFLGGIVVTLTPLIAGLFFGRYVLKLNPALLLGGIAGAQTMIAGVAAVQEKSDSQVATLGYSYTAAFGHIFLTTWGTIIVSLMT